MKTSKVAITIMFTLLMSSITGCSHFLATDANPVIEKSSGGVGLLTTKAERRVVVINKKKDSFCAEPSPDVAQNLLNELKASLDLSSGGIGKISDPKIKAEYFETIATLIDKLFNRTQGVQFFRDGLYNLCQACLNEFIEQNDYDKLYKDLLNTSKDLIAIELLLKNEAQSDNKSALERYKNLLEIVNSMRKETGSTNADE